MMDDFKVFVDEETAELNETLVEEYQLGFNPYQQ